MHEGHRQRLRQRFFTEGLDHFQDHQILEILLYHVFPRRDTNPLAHALMKRFGSLSAVLDADPRDLRTVEGIGEQTAAFLTMIPQLTRRYQMDLVKREKPILITPQAVKKFVKPLMIGRPEEVFYVLCLDLHGRLLYPALINRGTVQETLIHPRHVVEEILRHRASKVILAHNHPGGNPRPSKPDIEFTLTLINTLTPLNIMVQDHIIVAGNTCLSMAEEEVVDFGHNRQEAKPLPRLPAAVAEDTLLTCDWEDSPLNDSEEPT
ncbi:MAG: DNA repair protein RadC [Magnetococcales bacterium]|nr:DNA repair protein RadC [Magnetococcales bacterium]